MMHVGLGRSHPLHVEYIHLGVCLGFIQDIMSEAILSHPRLALARKIAIVKALGKLIWIQNDLFAKWHVRDGSEYAGHEDAIIEDEGYLHGRKILSDAGSGSSDADDEEEAEGATTPTKAAGVCPFSGIVRGVQDVKIADEEAARGTGEDLKPAVAERTDEAKGKTQTPSLIPRPTSDLPAMTGK